MSKSNDYFVFEEIDLTVLAKKVGECLDRGCELVGGVSAYIDPNYKGVGEKVVYLQAMIDKTRNVK